MSSYRPHECWVFCRMGAVCSPICSPGLLMLPCLKYPPGKARAALLCFGRSVRLALCLARKCGRLSAQCFGSSDRLGLNRLAAG